MRFRAAGMCGMDDYDYQMVPSKVGSTARYTVKG